MFSCLSDRDTLKFFGYYNLGYFLFLPKRQQGVQCWNNICVSRRSSVGFCINNISVELWHNTPLQSFPCVKLSNRRTLLTAPTWYAHVVLSLRCVHEQKYRITCANQNRPCSHLWFHVQFLRRKRDATIFQKVYKQVWFLCCEFLLIPPLVTWHSWRL